MGNSASHTAKIVRVVVAMLAAGCFLLGAAVTGAYLAVSHIVRTTVVQYAKVLGIALEPTDVRFGVAFVQVLDARFSVLEVPGVSGTIQRITVELSGLTPKRVLLSGVTLNARGDALTLKVKARDYWARLSKTTAPSNTVAPLPEIHWQHLTVHLADKNPLFPTATLVELTIVTNAGPTHDEQTIRAASARVGELDLGSIEVATRYQDGTFELGWGPTLHESKWRAAHRDLGSSSEWRFSFQAVEATKLLEQFGATTAAPALRTTKLQGHVEALRDNANGRTKGSLTLDLTGFAPPYPPELKGYKFSDVSTIRSSFEIDPQFLTLDLRGIEIETGDLALVGHGKVDRDVLSLQLRAELTTLLDCVTLAKGWAGEELGGDLGKWAIKNAPKAIQGSVAVRVQIEANTSRLDQAKVVKRIGIGCGLHPMTVVDLLNLGLPPAPDVATIERLLRRLPKQGMLASLPKLPQFIPALDGLQQIGTRGKPSQQKSTQAPANTARTSATTRTSPVPKATPDRH